MPPNSTYTPFYRRSVHFLCHQEIYSFRDVEMSFLMFSIDHFSQIKALKIVQYLVTYLIVFMSTLGVIGQRFNRKNSQIRRFIFANKYMDTFSVDVWWYARANTQSSFCRQSLGNRTKCPSQGRGYSTKFQLRLEPKTVNLFKTKICDCQYSISGPSQKSIPHFIAKCQISKPF